MPRLSKNRKANNCAAAREAKKTKQTTNLGHEHEGDQLEPLINQDDLNLEQSEPESSTSSSTPSTSSEPQDEPWFEENSRTIVEIKMIRALIGNLVCSLCFTHNLTLRTGKKKWGFAVLLEVFCTECTQVVSSSYTSEKPEHSKHFAVNVSAVISALMPGMGPVKFRKICEYMDLPALHHKTFNFICKKLFQNNDILRSEVFDRSEAAIRKEYLRSGLADNYDDVIDISVSFDGSWLTRGHKSLLGIGSVIETRTGLVLDLHFMSMYCQVCATTGEFHKRTCPAYYDDVWLKKHQEEGCSANFSGTSGMMEAHAASVLWARSMDRNFRYTVMVEDGDSKAYNRVRELKLYGPNVEIEEEECLNHVSKRLGTGLRNLVQNCNKKGITLGGKGYGRLTQDKIRKLEIYYARAIRGNTTAAEMKSAILAAVYHGFSTNELPQHQYCPPGEDSWCFWKRALAKNEDPFRHTVSLHTALDFKLLGPHLIPLYERLTEDNLLKRCERKAIKNRNESLHNVIWSKCPKSAFHGREKCEFTSLMAISEFNFGPQSVMDRHEICLRNHQW